MRNRNLHLALGIVVAMIVAFALSGCQRASDKALAEWELVERYATDDEKCRASRKVADAYLKEGNASQYRWWGAASRVYCFDVGTPDY